MSYLVFAWMASFIYGLSVVVSKLATKYSVKNPWLFNFFWSLFVLFFTLIIFVFSQTELKINSWPNLVLASLFSALTGIFYVLTLYKMDISILSPLFNLRSAISVLLGVLILKESFSFFQLALVVTIIVSGIFVTVDEKWNLKSFFNIPILLALITMIFLSFYGLFLNKSISQNGYWVTTMCVALLDQFLLLLTAPAFIRDIKSSMRASSIAVISMVALLGTLASLASNKAFSENIGISSVIQSLPFSMIMVFALSIIYPKLLEKHPVKIYLVRFISAALMITAALRLSL